MAQPQSSYPKQAIVVIHGIGEQQPMDTIDGFVRAVWDREIATADPDIPDPDQVWSKPDLRTGSLELRRITTRQSVGSNTFPDGIRSDFYELYWADLSGGSTWDEVKAWIFGLLLRNPFKRVPGDVFLAWLLLWALTLLVIFFALATALPEGTTICGHKLSDYPPLSWPKWLLAALTAVIAWVEHQLVVPYIGRVVRYTRATPENIAARKNIRERGLQLLAELHKSEYDRIIVVGHSLGSILAYDLVSYFWASRSAPRNVTEGSAEFAALQALETATADLEPETDPEQVPAKQAAFLGAQRAFAESLRRRPKPDPKDPKQPPDPRWLITDLVTLGSPLTHAEFLLAHDEADLRAHMGRRELPTVPPLREPLDPDNKIKARNAKLPDSRLMCFPLDEDKQWQLHHAAPFAAVRWTNIHDPAFLVLLGDQISGPVAPLFGRGVIDINLKTVRGQAQRFSHTRYWSAAPGEENRHVARLRAVLDLAYRNET